MTFQVVFFDFGNLFLGIPIPVKMGRGVVKSLAGKGVRLRGAASQGKRYKNTINNYLFQLNRISEY